MFDERLKETRKKKGFTQVSLAEELGVSKGTIAMWETGKRKPDFEMLCRISELFDVKTDYLLGQSDDDSSAIFSDKDIDQLESWETEEYLLDMFKTYLSLDEYGKATADNLIRSEAIRCRNQGTLTEHTGIVVSVTIES